MEQLERQDFVLLVASDPVVGLDFADALDAAGFLVAGPMRTVAEADEWLLHWKPALAVLDLDVGDEAGIRLAHTLRERGVSFMIHAERDSFANRSDALADAPCLPKPAWHQDVIDTMREVMRSGQVQ